MSRSYNINKIAIFVFFLINLCSCVDDDFVSSVNRSNSNHFTLRIPEMNAIDITTRSGNSNAIESLLAVVIRESSGGENKAEYELISDASAFSNGGDKVLVTLKTLGVLPGENLYVFCNLDIIPSQSALSAVKDTTELFQTVICTSRSDKDKDVMYGVRLAGATDNSIKLSHSLSKVEVVTDGAKYSIDSLLIGNAPKIGYANGNGYEPTEVVDVNFKYGATKFFVPRPDNNESSKTTFILVKLRDRNWYRLDFYANGENLENGSDYKKKLLKITPQTFYLFNIKSVMNNGYATKEEARKNPGSNIVYSLSVGESSSASNGQYALMTSTDQIMLCPGGTTSGTIDISAILQDNAENEVTTYSAHIFNRKGKPENILMGLGEPTSKDSLNLMLESDNKLTTANSKRTIAFSCESGWIEDYYLEIRLGNIVKVVSFKILTANSYLMDCSKTNAITIPFSQANLVPKQGKAQRIEKGDVDGVEVIWADQPYEGKLIITPEYDKGWFKVTPVAGNDFAGNIIVGVRKDDTVLWSWHIWCMRNDGNNPIYFDKTRGIYDYKDQYRQTYSGSVWMDRNLGAYDLNKEKSSSRGLAYSHGRKDPFILTEHILGNIPLSPVKFPEATMYCEGGTFIMDGVHPKFMVGGYKNFPMGTDDQEMLEYSIKYPYSLTSTIISGLSDYYWRTKYGNYWLTEDGNKSGYDPCPIGWRVPYVNDPLGPWSALSYANRVLDSSEEYGPTWIIGGQEIFYPYVPYRISLGPGGYIGTDAVDAVGGQRIKSFRLVCADNFVPHVGIRFMGETTITHPERQPGVKYWLRNIGQALATRCVRDK